jgi:hypothetical protein
MFSSLFETWGNWSRHFPARRDLKHCEVNFSETNIQLYRWQSFRSREGENFRPHWTKRRRNTEIGKLKYMIDDDYIPTYLHRKMFWGGKGWKDCWDPGSVSGQWILEVAVEEGQRILGGALQEGQRILGGSLKEGQRRSASRKAGILGGSLKEGKWILEGVF